MSARVVLRNHVINQRFELGMSVICEDLPAKARINHDQAPSRALELTRNCLYDRVEDVDGYGKFKVVQMVPGGPFVRGSFAGLLFSFWVK